MAVDLGEPRRSQVATDARVRVAVLALAERFTKHALRTAEVTLVRERGAEVAREADVRGDVAGVVPVELVQAVLEQLDRALVRADQGVGAGQTCKGVGAVERRDACVDSALKVLGGFGGPVELCSNLAEADLGADRRRCVAGIVRLSGERSKRLVRGFGLAADSELELGVREAQLALVDVAELGARLEVFGRDAECPGQRSECLHGRATGSGLDPRDVRVRDARAGQLALGQPTLEAKAPSREPDRLWLTATHGTGGS